MSKIYFPIRKIDVKASNHGIEESYFRVSVGFENWGDDEAKYVAKVQMAYLNKKTGRLNVSGRKAPSYLIGTSDFENVHKAMMTLLEGEGQTARGEMSSI